MSQLPPGLAAPAPPPPPAPRAASSIVLWREGPAGRELFWVRRGAPLRSFGGFFAFPGGKVDREDGQVPVVGASGEAAASVAAAARELFEETGVLAVSGAGHLGPGARDAARRALLAGELRFGELVAREALRIDAADFIPAGRWITPPAYPARFDARTYLVRMPPDEAAVVWPGELSFGEWIATGEALRRWGAGEVLLHPPNLWPIQCLDRAGPPACLEPMRTPQQVEDGITRRIEFQQGLFLATLRTPTLPPAFHTNCWLPEIEGGLAIVDPGSPWPEEQARLERLLDELAGEGRPPREIWLTHAHPDHVGGVARLRDRYRLLLRAHPDAASRLPAGLGEALPVLDGELLAGRWRALHTPGHADGHLVFHDERTGALLCGDLVSTLSTIVIDPPEGDMARYLASLERVRALAPRTLFPAHGGPAPDGVATLEAYVAHRRAREEKVLRALGSACAAGAGRRGGGIGRPGAGQGGPTGPVPDVPSAVPDVDASGGPGATLEEVTALAYDDTPVAVHPVAARSCLASLRKLVAEGKAREVDGRWLSAPP